jgi:hypothetical protein
VELGVLHWWPKWAGDETIMFPIVVKRTWMRFSKLKDKGKKHGQQNFFELDTVKEEGDWVYYAVVANMNLHKYSSQEVMETM